MSDAAITDDKTVLAMPGYGQMTAGAARGFWRASRTPGRVVYQYMEGSLLAHNFNRLWSVALNMEQDGEPIRYFAMQHADVEPEDFWLDTLIEEMEAKRLDVLGVVVPIKDRKGTTSLALARDDGDSWRPHCRLTMQEVYQLPETFTSEDCGRPLLINTGLWVCRFDPAWAKKVHFEINDRIVYDTIQNKYRAQVEPEDWCFSRCCHDLGLKIGATRKISLTHRGDVQFPNISPWGEEYFDSSYLNESALPAKYLQSESERFPFEIDGWLSPNEGAKLAELAKGKRVLEIGSYCGLSTVCLARTASQVVAVDPHDGRATPRPKDTRAEFLSNLVRYGVNERVAVHPSLDDVTGPFDLAFIDGDHSIDAVRSDYRRIVPMLAPDGLIAFHDYRDYPGQYDGRWDEGVRKAVDEFLACGAEIVTRADTLAVVRPGGMQVAA